MQRDATGGLRPSGNQPGSRGPLASSLPGGNRTGARAPAGGASTPAPPLRGRCSRAVRRRPAVSQRELPPSRGRPERREASRPQWAALPGSDRCSRPAWSFSNRDARARMAQRPRDSRDLKAGHGTHACGHRDTPVRSGPLTSEPCQISETPWNAYLACSRAARVASKPASYTRSKASPSPSRASGGGSAPAMRTSTTSQGRSRP